MDGHLHQAKTLLNISIKKLITVFPHRVWWVVEAFQKVLCAHNATLNFERIRGLALVKLVKNHNHSSAIGTSNLRKLLLGCLVGWRLLNLQNHNHSLAIGTHNFKNLLFGGIKGCRSLNLQKPINIFQPAGTSNLNGCC